MSSRTITIAMNGVTGRMGRTQHLMRSIVAIREEGGITLKDGTRLMPDPILVGRNETKLRELAEAAGVKRWTTAVDEVLNDPAVEIYFDSQVTSRRADALREAIEAGKAVYCEKPLAEDAATAFELAQLATDRTVKNGIVQDKLFLPGLRKLRRVLDSGSLGRVLSVSVDFGYWVFDGTLVPAQRPSWNYRSEEGGGIILDMFPHWQYVLEDLFAPVTAIVCLGATHLSERVDESGQPYRATADDAAHAILQLEGGTVAQISASWTTRVRRDELVMFHVDGTDGSAEAGLRGCWIQPHAATPRPTWNPDVPNPIDFRSMWLDMPEIGEGTNGFRLQWERFLRHVAEDAPFPWDLTAGARGSQLADLALTSWRERRWVDVPGLST